MSERTEATDTLGEQRFNEPQKRRLLASVSYMDKLLIEIEEILSASSSGGFPKYKNPLAPVQVRVVRDYIKRLRQQIGRVLADLDVPLPEPRFDSTFSIRVTLQFIEVAIEEIGPQRLVGYGPVPDSLVKPLAGGLQEMKGIVRQMDSYLSQRIEADLSNRLLQLGEKDSDAALLKKLLLEDWVAHQITPRVTDAKRLSRESNHRKLRSVSRRILHALEMSTTGGGARSHLLSDDLKKAEMRLREVAGLIETTQAQGFRLADALRSAGESALDQLTQDALTFWEQESSPFGLDQSWVTERVHQLAQNEVERIANLIQTTAQQLTAALDMAATVLSTGEREDRFDLQNFVKEMPPAEFASDPLHLEKPRWLSLSVGMARRSIRNDLTKRLGTAIMQFFSSYGRTLEVWLRGTLDSLAREFETHADIYRAQFQRLTAGATSATDVPAEGVLRDVSFLRRELELEETEQPVESGAVTQ